MAKLLFHVRNWRALLAVQKRVEWEGEEGGRLNLAERLTVSDLAVLYILYSKFPKCAPRTEGIRDQFSGDPWIHFFCGCF